MFMERAVSSRLNYTIELATHLICLLARYQWLTTRLPSTKVEPFHGFVETTGDALRLIHAARQGLIPRTTRRLNDLESAIWSGAVHLCLQ